MINPLFAHKLLDRLPWTIAGPLKRRYPEPFGFYFVFNKNPLIVLIPEDFFDELWRWTPLFEALKKRRVYFIGLVRSGFEFDPPGYKPLISSVLAAHAQKYPEHRFIMLANNPAQAQIYTELGIETAFINQNCLQDDTAISINPAAPKRFDAIYNAACAPYKRLELAAQVENLAIITYLQPRHLDYFEHSKNLLAHAQWLNFPDGDPNKEPYHSIPGPEVCGLLNQSRVGLCLSHIEGSMFAAIEYLLAGLPIVSTPSFGGRDVFFDDAYVAIVEADPEAVRIGVQQMLDKQLDPYEIRTETLRKMAVHRQRLVDLIVDIAAREGVEADRQSVYAHVFPNPIYKLRPLHKIL
ncbi:MAG: glycosyltransferase family 4 protein [Methylococcaceae bacterium]|nr:glycosyltransferase family 4 protein [Methylococcaceae bacterium]